MAKQLNARIITKHDKEENWKKAISFIPKLGEIIVYESDNLNWVSLVPRIKVGDGFTTISELPFITDPYVVKEEGKGLSSNDFTDFLRTKLVNIPENAKYTDTLYTAGVGLGLNGTEFYNKGLSTIGPGTKDGFIKIAYRLGPGDTEADLDVGEFRVPGLKDTAFTNLESIFAKIKNGTQNGTINVNGNDINITGLQDTAFLTIQDLQEKIYGEAAQEVYIGQNIEDYGSTKIWIKEELDTGLTHLYYFNKKENGFTEFQTSNIRKIEESIDEGPGTFRVVTFSQNESYIIHIVPDIQLSSPEIGVIEITKGNEPSFKIPIKGLINDPEYPELLAFLPLTGGTITGTVSLKDTTAATSTTTGALTVAGGLGVVGEIYGNKVHGAVYNDYAEYRISETLLPGYCIHDTQIGIMLKTHERLMPCCKIVSDTFGFAIGKTDKARTPVAVCGRVLARPLEEREIFEIGDCVCSGPYGTVSKMTREEIVQYPDRIVGIVSEIPEYETWGEDNIKIDGRIWIYVK